MSLSKEVNIGVVTVSDRASEGIYQDISGQEIQNTMREFLSQTIRFCYRLIADEQKLIEQALYELADNEGCSLILTTGGTGPAVRDVTPEATEKVCEKMLPGFGELMRARSLQYVPTAILSRQSAGIYRNSLIVNLPGKPKSIRECLEAVFPAIPYCIDLIGGSYFIANEEVIKAFRPPQK